MNESYEAIKVSVNIFTAALFPLSIFLAFWQIKKTLDWNKKKAAEEVLTQILSGDVFKSLEAINVEYDWDLLVDKRSYKSVIKELDADQVSQLNGLLTTLLRHLETISIKIEHDVYNESICFDYLFSIVINTHEKCREFIDERRAIRSEPRLYEHVDNYGEKWKRDIKLGRKH